MTLPPQALPDVLRPGLKVVFVGTAAGRRSAAVGAYYAHPGNRFWKTLAEVGLTPRRYESHEFMSLLDIGLGFTDVAKHASGMDHQIAAEHFDPAGLAAKLAHYEPRLVAFTSKKAASIFLGVPTKRLGIGRQFNSSPGGPALFVLPSPSGAARRSWSIEPWRELAAAARQVAGQDDLEETDGARHENVGTLA